MGWQERWVDRFYRQRPGWRDGTTEFHGLCEPLVPRGARILEIGAGPPNQTSAFLARLGELHGIDVDSEVLTNHYLKSSAVIRDEQYPFTTNYFDLAVSNYVVEHVERPIEHLREVARVLKPGGHYVLRTPNLWHYVALVSRFTPHAFHVRTANKLRNLATDEHDPWPTVYAMNTPRRLRSAAVSAGLTIERLDLVEKEPSYGMYARPLFAAFLVYERLVNSSIRFAAARANMFAILRKPRTSPTS